MSLSRRQFLQRSATLLASAWAAPCGRVLAQPRFTAAPYTLGVASGYPHAGGMTLWTRLAPLPLEGGDRPFYGFLASARIRILRGGSV